MADEERWIKSSRCVANNHCVEVAWFKSSHSADTANCVELAVTDQVLVRDSKDPSPVLSFSRQDWQRFVNWMTP